MVLKTIGIVALFVMSYISGSVPYSYLIPKLLTGIDIRKIGSGNVGATNATRATNLYIGLLCVIGDIGKAIIPTLLALALFGWGYVPLLIGIAAVLGHDYSIFMRFKGGKGVAATLGVIFVYSFLTGSIFVVIWLVIVILSQYASLASLIAMVFAAASIIVDFPIHTDIIVKILFLFLAGLSFYQHRENIKRIVRGTENKIDLFKYAKKRLRRNKDDS